jgi:WD40 repeat protein
VKIWNTSTWEVQAVCRGHSQPVLALAFSPDGRRLASAAKDSAVRLWDVESGEPTALLSEHSSWVHDVVFGAAGRWLVAAGDTAIVWDSLPGSDGQR